MPPSTAPQPPNLAMNSAQNTLVEGLQPALRSTLSSLNINLDYELARYRHAKRGEAPSGGTQTPFRPRRQSSLDLISVAQASSTARPSTLQPPPLLPNPKLQSIESPPGMTESTSEVAALRSAIVRQSAVQDGYMAAAAPLPNSDNGSSFSEAAPTALSRHHSAKWLTPLGLGALLLLLVSSAGLGFLLVNPTAASNLFQQTPLARFFPNEEVDEATTAEGDAVAENAAETTFEEPPLTPLSPDLSQREFSDLELNNLSTLPSSSASLSEGIAPQSLQDRQAGRLEGDRAAIASGETTTNFPRQVNQIPTTTTPAPQPAAPVYQAPAPASSVEPATQPAPPSEPRTQPTPPSTPESSSTSEPTSQAPQSSYYVVTDYTGDPSLDDARTVVQDAYVRNFEAGARIQLGAFSTEAGAAELTEALREQGIEAEVYEP